MLRGVEARQGSRSWICPKCDRNSVYVGSSPMATSCERVATCLGLRNFVRGTVASAQMLIILQPGRYWSLKPVAILFSQVAQDCLQRLGSSVATIPSCDVGILATAQLPQIRRAVRIRGSGLWSHGLPPSRQYNLTGTLWGRTNNEGCCISRLGWQEEGGSPLQLTNEEQVSA